ncbi:hypothetical protein BHR79_10025 [Methanohalophilus halophilus]|uniref:Uncharacterized protein n=2 Tax=Methanohalophilus halophilus TaxID=2177 RepID=A0A1L3Q4H4_9EURY|nr:hypothetical protein BHR79_10025 [Methanohalophilus halophilus]RNI08880.1 hypothetical protein EFE40_05235 [Methanohalophilus halophilus]SDW40166.1 hypothetical protein SAMN04515625_0925 [Methanohalophilus halophilus]
MLIITIILAAIVGSQFLSSDVTDLQKPSFAAFEATTETGINNEEPEIPIVILQKTAGDQLSQEYEEGTHSGIKGTEIYLFDPAGERHEVINSIYMTGKEVETAEKFYIFYFNHYDGNFWITNDKVRVTEGGVEYFDPSGQWRLQIIGAYSNQILLDKKLQL